MATQVMKYKITRPIDCDWEMFNAILRKLRYKTRYILNKCIQAYWEWDGFSSEYKQKYNEYPNSKIELGYCGSQSVRNYVKNKIKEHIYIFNQGNVDTTLNIAMSKWNNNRKDIKSGDVSIPSFKNNCPIDIKDKMIQIYKEKNKYYLKLSLISNPYKKELKRKSGQFLIQINPGKDYSKSILEKILNGEYKISASQIVEKKDKWFINLCYSFKPQKKHNLDPNTVMGIDLGMKNVAYFAFNNSKDRGYIEGGEIDEFRRRTEKRRNSILKQGKYCGEGRRGHGINTRLKPIKKMSDKVSNFRDTANHKYSKYIVEQALKNNAGIIQMEDLSEINKDDKFLKNWSYYDLQQKIEYKAKREGIKIIYIDPKYTSQRCSSCGHIDKNSRPNQATFKCTSCGESLNADYNAAKNISLSNIEELIEEQCKIQGLPYKKKSVKKSA